MGQIVDPSSNNGPYPRNNCSTKDMLQGPKCSFSHTVNIATKEQITSL